MNQKGNTRVVLGIVVVIVSAILYAAFIQKNSDLLKTSSSYSDSQLVPSPIYPTPIIAPVPVGPTLTSSSTAVLLRACPEQWYDNRMPTIIEPGITRDTTQYFIYKGVRREISEFDINWVKNNCSVKPSIVY